MFGLAIGCAQFYCSLGAAFVHHQHHDTRPAAGFVQSAQDTGGVGHLGDELRRNKTAGFNRIKTCLQQQVDDPDLLFGGDELLNALESIPGGFDDLYQC